MEYIVRVKFQDENKFIVFSENELNWKTFVDKGRFYKKTIKYFSIFIVIDFRHTKGFSSFGVKIHERSTVYLTDNLGTKIPQDLFASIIKYFRNGSNFYVEIKFTATQNNHNDLVTPQVKRDFFLVLKI